MKVHHIVLVQYKPGIPESRFAELCSDLRMFLAKLPGVGHFCEGPYQSPEGANQGFTHGLIMTFDSHADRDRYLVHEEHEAIKARYLPDVANVVAFDFEEKQPVERQRRPTGR